MLVSCITADTIVSMSEGNATLCTKLALLGASSQVTAEGEERGMGALSRCKAIQDQMCLPQVLVPSTAVRRQMPARSARTTKKLVEIVSSSESECSSDDSTDAEEDT